MTRLLIILAVWLLAVNVVAYDRMGEDKIRALAGQRRLPESALLALALVGGALGVQLGRMTHGNRGHPHFSRRLASIAVVQAIVAFILGWTVVAGG